MSFLEDAQQITEYRIPKNKAEIREEEDNYVLRVEDKDLLHETHEVNDLPETVECPECEQETAEQDSDDQLYICTDCGRETVMIGGYTQ